MRLQNALKIIRSVEASTRYHAFPRFGALGVILKALRSSIEYSYKSMLRLSQVWAPLAPLRNIRGRFSSNSLLILANGPSLTKLNASKVNEIKQSRKLKILVMNNFFDTTLAKVIEPDFYVLSDPLHSPISMHEKSIQLWAYLTTEFQGTLFVPRTWKVAGTLEARTIYFEDRQLVGLSRSTSPLKPRGYVSLTPMKALSLAGFLGFKEIFTLGLDHSMFQGLQVNSRNEVIQQSVYFQGTATVKSSVIRDWSVHDYFFDLAVTSFQFKNFFGNLPVFNLNPGSFITSFQKGDPLGITFFQSEDYLE